MADTAHAGSMGCIEAFLHIRDRGIAIGAGDQVVLTAGNLVVNGLLRHSRNELGDVRLLRQTGQIAGDVEDHAVHVLGDGDLVGLGLLRAVLLFHNGQRHGEGLAQAGGGAALLVVQLGQLLAAHGDGHLIGCLVGLAIVLQRLVVQIDGMAAADDAHDHADHDQLEEEFKQCLDLAKYCLGTVGLLDKCTFRFSQWDPANPNNKYEGTAEQWEHAQSAMERILKDLDVEYTIGIDEAAFYGPKLDIQYKNVYGKEDTLVTIQIDMLLAERFGMYYIDENGNKALPYIIHRTSLGCYERTLAYLIEEYAGALPTWMMPEQVRFLPITDRAADYCAEAARELRKQGFRVEVDSRNEKVGKKIREATLEKIPFMLVVGDRDMENGTVSVRTRKGEDLGAMSLSDFSAKLHEIVDSKSRD